VLHAYDVINAKAADIVSQCPAWLRKGLRWRFIKHPGPVKAEPGKKILQFWPTHPDKHVAALQSLHPILQDLMVHDKGRDPDCQFTSFIHANENIEPAETLTRECRRKCTEWLIKVTHIRYFVLPYIYTILLTTLFSVHW
jgi:hypothetical protein